MSEKSKRRPNFTSDEVEVLVSSMRKRKCIIEAKFSAVIEVETSITAASKEKAWQEVAKELTAVSTVERTVDEVKKKWSCLKSATKGKLADKRK
jgi:hypothetical protein